MSDTESGTETDSLLIDYRTSMDPDHTEVVFNSRGANGGSMGRRRQSSDEELLDVMTDRGLETATGFTNKDIEPGKFQSKCF